MAHNGKHFNCVADIIILNIQLQMEDGIYTVSTTVHSGTRTARVKNNARVES